MKLLYSIQFISFISLFVSQQNTWAYSAYSCNEAWEIDNSTTADMFRTWILYRQNKCESGEVNTVIHSAGIAATISHIVEMMLLGWELNRYFRASTADPYLWGALDEKECSFHRRSVDCYHIPYSICGFEYTMWEKAFAPMVAPHINQTYLKEALHILPANIGMDTCTIGKRIKRSIQWIQAAILDYVLRHRYDVALAIDAKTHHLFGHSFPTANHMLSVEHSHYHKHTNVKGTRNGTLAIQMRTGNGEILDAGRVFEPTLDRYMEIIDTFAAYLEAQGSPLGVVYLCSNNPSYTYHSAEFMKSHYPRPYAFVELPHLELGPADPLTAHRRNVNAYQMKTDDIPSNSDRNNYHHTNISRTTNSSKHSSLVTSDMRDLVTRHRIPIIYPAGTSPATNSSSMNYTMFDLHVEFFTDIHIFRHVDVLIGSDSFVYLLSSLFRKYQDHDPKPLNTTCLVSFGEKGNPVFCEDDREKMSPIWKNRMKYTGGTIYG